MKKLTKKEKEDILILLEELATKLGIQIEYANLLPEFREGGNCRVINKQRIIIERRLSLDRKIDILSSNLKKYKLDEVFVPPLLKTFLELE
jgi:hypothetical protein